MVAKLMWSWMQSRECHKFRVRTKLIFLPSNDIVIDRCSSFAYPALGRVKSIASTIDCITSEQTSFIKAWAKQFVSE